MENRWERLYSKNGLAARLIATKLLAVEPGNRIPRVSDFVTEFSMGRGTVQGAFRLLEDIGAIHLESRGHLGTYLMNHDRKLLWEIAGLGSMVGVMPLPYSRKYEGLATGLVHVFENLKVPFSLAYMRGATNRLEALQSKRYDFAIVSRMAGEIAAKENANLEFIRGFGPSSYVSGHEIYFADPKAQRITDGMRIGIDYSSSDQHYLTMYETERMDVELVEVNYMQLIEMLKNREIDAAVWNKDEFKSHESLGRAEFQSNEALEVSKKICEAVVMIEADRHEMREVLKDIEVDTVCEFQHKVENGAIYPRY